MVPLASFCQQSAAEKLQMANDSLSTNPNFAYTHLLALSKDPTNDYAFKAKTYLALGGYFNGIGVVDSSLYYTRKSLIHLRDERYKADAYRIIGSCHRRSGKIDDAMIMLFKSLKIAERNQYKTTICQVKSDLGILYASKKEYDKAIGYFKESIEVATSNKEIYSNYINIGATHFLKNDLENAKKMFIKGFEQIPPDSDPNASSTLALNIGSILYESKKYDEAATYYQKSKEIAVKHGFKDKLINAEVHQAMILDAKGKSKEAIDKLLKLLPQAKVISNLQIQQNIYEDLTYIYSKINDYKAANDALKHLHTLKDSVSNAQQKKEITELEVKYETAQKETEIVQLKKDQIVKSEEIKRQQLLKKTFVIGFIIILIPIIALLLMYYQKLKMKTKYNLQKDEINKQKISSFLKEQELKIANTYMQAQNEERSRIARELHDSIGGNLAAIKLQMLNEHEEKRISSTLVDQLDDTYEQLRAISHDLIPKKIHQTEFSKYLKDYIDIIQKVTVPEISFIPYPADKLDLIEEDKKLEIFKIIQELLTNALKHAKAKLIEVCLNGYQDTVEIIFEDNGIGFDEKKQKTGIGLQNIRERLKKLKATMDIDSVSNRGTAIRIQIPTNYELKK